MTLTARIARSPGTPAVLAFAFVMWGIGVPSFWRDESVSVLAARMSFDELRELLSHIDTVHALYYLLLRPFAALGGEVAVRLPSALAVAGAAAGITALGRRLSAPGSWTGTYAGLAYALIPMVSRYGQETRSYALVSAVAVASTLVLLGERRSRHAGYGLLVALLGWFHLYALLLLPAHALIVLRRGRREILPWLAALAGAAVLLVPLVLMASGQRDEQLFWLKTPDLAALAQLGVEISGGPVSWQDSGTPPLFLALLGLLALLGVWYGRASLTEVALPWALVPVALSYAISQVYPVYNPRYVMFVLPALALLAGAGLAGLPRPFSGRAPIGLAALAALAALSMSAQLTVRGPANRPDDLRTLAAELGAAERPGDAVLYAPERFWLFVSVYGGPYGKLVPFDPGAERVWLVSRRLPGTEWQSDPRLAALKRGFTKAGPTRISGAVRVTLYTRRLPSNHERPPSAARARPSR
ncbi:hypothetical protein [Streptosporangium jomthongense]|uniref:Glycosyltransferase RgtA/B/C/D-like domain-containing protein n=1 Tax=Streptosporangium jomthongense TaxID=1193683 RepID=A0ABV8FB92_9ACTN